MTTENNLLTQREKIPTRISDQPRLVSQAVAEEIAELIKTTAAEGRPCVLGLATGSSPVGVYDELVRKHKNEGLSFENVVTFNLDEYFPIDPTNLQSYRRFMNEHLFDHVDIKPENIHIPDGSIAAEEVSAHCQAYEQAILDVGGIDLQLLGIGRTGHIGFNEPGSSRDSRTRLITLDQVTRIDAASDFFGEENVPRRAITMGVGTILSARRVILMAFGESKAPVIAHAVEGQVTLTVAASFLQEHENAQIVLDRAAAAELTQLKSPWQLGPVEWDQRLTRKAVIWLAQTVNKPILKLTDVDYNEHGLQDLLATSGSAYDQNIEVFREMQETITGWPGGKPVSKKRPGDVPRTTDAIFPKRVLVFSPHPDDDVISMGGTLIRLVDHGHDVHVAYQTSGNIAVFDVDALKHVDFANDLNQMFGLAPEQSESLERDVVQFLRHKTRGQIDSPEVRRIKGLIRRGEAKAAGRYCGVPEDNLHFLDLPFYETGTIKKEPPTEKDFEIVATLLEKLQPHQIYAAGDLSDPHGTHRTCLAIIFEAIKRIKGQPWYADCEVWLYRGAWQEWSPHEIEMAVPLSPAELDRKRHGIFKHESQKDKALFPGIDEREFWQRAEDRNRATAVLYDNLGLAEYEAIEGFVQWHGQSTTWY